MPAWPSELEIEEVVDELVQHPFQVLLPSVAVEAVAVVPGGARPSYAHGYYERQAFYEAWDPINRDRDRFTERMERHIMGTEGSAECPESVGARSGSQ